MKTKMNPFLIIGVIVAAVFFLGKGIFIGQVFPTGCTAPPGSQVIFRTNATPYFHITGNNYIAANFDTGTKQYTSSLIAYKQLVGSGCSHNFSAANFSNFNAFLSPLTYNIANGARSFYDTRTNFQNVYILDTADCTNGLARFTWYPKAGIPGEIDADSVFLQLSPLEPYTSSCQELYNIQSCVENWQCSEWSTCSGGTQSRTCTDSNACGTTDSKPAESQSCTVTYPYSITPPPTSYCFQESANVATACGGLSSGTYTSADFSGLSVRYSIPSNTNNAVVRVKAIHNQMPTPTDYYISLPSQCLSKSNGLLELNIGGSNTAGGGACGTAGENSVTITCRDNNNQDVGILYSSGGRCCGNGNNYGKGVSAAYDGDYNTPIAFYNGFFRQGFDGASLFEEAIYWNIGAPSGIPGDSNGDGHVDRTELGSAISQWLSGSMTRQDLGAVIQSWVQG